MGKKFENKYTETKDDEIFKHKIKNIKLNIIETSGNSIKLKNVLENYNELINGIIFIYDISDENTFNSLILYKKIIFEILINEVNKCGIVVVGNKNDLNENHTKYDFNFLYESLNRKVPHFEISLKDNYDVNDVLKTLIKETNKFSFKKMNKNIEKIVTNSPTIKSDNNKIKKTFSISSFLRYDKISSVFSKKNTSIDVNLIDKNYTYNFLILGNIQVGKTAL
jgi:signal recognition particle receptor subunit beta